MRVLSLKIILYNIPPMAESVIVVKAPAGGAFIEMGELPPYNAYPRSPRKPPLFPDLSRKWNA